MWGLGKMMSNIISIFFDREEIAASGSGTEVNFHIIFIPNCSLLCEMRLKDRGVYGSFTYINELQLFWFPLDTDVISMEKR